MIPESTILDLSAAARAQGLELALDDLTETDRRAAVETWRGRMVNEHISARVFAALIPQLMAAGVDSQLTLKVAQMIQDELRHGQLCAAVVLALGEPPIAALPALEDTPAHAEVTPREALLRNILSVSCLSETVAVALISAEHQETGPKPLQDLLKSILADEVQHARFGWTLLEDQLPKLTPEARARLGDYLAYAFAHLRQHELKHIPLNGHPSAAARAYGVCYGQDARQLFFDTVEQVIISRLQELGLPAQEAWRASFIVEKLHS